MESNNTTLLNDTRVLDRVLRKTQNKKLDLCHNTIKNKLMESFNYVTVPKTYFKKPWYIFGKLIYYYKNEFISYEMLDSNTEELHTYEQGNTIIAWINNYKDNAAIMCIGDLKLVIIDRRKIAEENRRLFSERDRKNNFEFVPKELLLQTPPYREVRSAERFTQNSLSDYAVISGNGNIVRGCKNYDVLEDYLIEVVSDYIIGFKMNGISDRKINYINVATKYLIHFIPSYHIDYDIVRHL